MQEQDKDSSLNAVAVSKFGSDELQPYPGCKCLTCFLKRNQTTFSYPGTETTFFNCFLTPLDDVTLKLNPTEGSEEVATLAPGDEQNGRPISELPDSLLPKNIFYDERQAMRDLSDRGISFKDPFC